MIKVAVVGAGVIGLSTAVELQKRPELAVTVISESFSPNTTGDVSAGLWSPYLLQNTPLDKTTKWAKDTQDMMLDLWKNGHAMEAGVSLIPIMRLSSEDELPPEWLSITFGYSVLSKDQLDRINECYKKTYKGGYAFVSFTLEPKKFLPFLEKRFLVNGGTIKNTRVEDLDSLFSSYDLVVNCTGLSSGRLLQDERVKPIRGQITRVSAPWLYHTIMDDDDDGNYIIPNTDSVILGGTHQTDDYNLKVDDADKKMILDGCFKIVPSLKNAPLIKHQVGLRPGRDEVRVELEPYRKQKGKWIIHNYGHGGSGVTLCYGCAIDAAILVVGVMKLKKNKL